MNHAIISRSVLRCLVPGLAIAASGDAAAAGFTSGQSLNAAATDGAVPSVLRPDFSRCAAMDPLSGRVFVSIKCPSGNSVLRFASAAVLEAGGAPEAIFSLPVLPGADGQPDRQNPPDSPALTCDAEGRVWVADTANHRVLRFDDAAALPSGASASGVLGQADFTGFGRGLSASRMNFPSDLAVDAHGRLYVADTGNGRVLWFNKAARRGNGASANGVIGQADFESRAPHDDSLMCPSRVALEGGCRGVPVTLWVADFLRRRALRFDNALSLPMAGARASAVMADGKMGLE